ncbi:c-type cytochrome [Chitinasiproducens palmae]|uniref:c-type cytochrome n=1 Tax=Chitinasiproducens palmae TaxID=1770053 RepID=UPI001F1A02AA|nr:c-type cytochrome [Chitinasiproducens palmae]
MISASANAQSSNAPKPPPDTMEARVMACAACHGVQGAGLDNNYFPRLAGRPAGYLYEQLRAFRDGTRSYAPMNALLAYLSDDYLHKMAEYYAAQQPPFPPHRGNLRTDAIREQGRRLVANGDAARGIPACATCHGASLTGLEPGIPGLLGLNASYLSGQLGEFRAHTRRGARPDCMANVAAKLSDADITAVSAYLAAQPKPADAAPARQTAELPLVCGSQAR